MSEWDLAARTAELEAAIANADRAEAAKSMNQLSQKAREWTDDRCVAAAEVYLSQTGNLKRSYKLREATKLANQTEAKAYIVRGLERLLSGPKHEETAAALKELSKKN
ncbi:MAG: hypothetical protein FP825_06610 [Hyphomonas sp.]|uniref:hypothetical protein n=1 Tax=Hyphomonas sp. TaxID=87 RepID=UPI0017DD584F|nr:hypothetical protein [Hyphomonas sp.]MBA3068131.1 hypothetical protein [Hyphomonas sp.]MBU3922022.1 hypothetical protein [Alphaproteobacteria bacterium]MBU4061134.1 hypothetical protein [Alphaproteobacteria bacterium]MBU4162858.1 hypothetical protein [Alphaproteobacteria bacterium]